MSLRILSTSALVSVLSLSALIQVASAASFSDVPSTHLNAEAIAYVKAQGIVSGYPDGTYKPNQTINRAEFIKIVIASKFTNEIEIGRCTHDSDFGPFSDVGFDNWFSSFVCMATEKKIISGYPDGTFRPSDAISFVEASKILAKVFIGDLGSDPVWYKPFVESLALRYAVPQSILSFDQQITRGEMAEMIWRLKAGVTSKPSQTFASLSSTGKVNENRPIVYRGSDYNGVETIFVLELPADWVGFGAQKGNPRDIKFIGDTNKYGTRDEGAKMEVTRVLTNENTHGRQVGQSWFDFYIGMDNPRFIVTKQEKHGDIQFYELTAKDQRDFPLPYFFLFETDKAIVGLAFKDDNATTKSIVASFKFTD